MALASLQKLKDIQKATDRIEAECSRLYELAGDMPEVLDEVREQIAGWLNAATPIKRCRTVMTAGGQSLPSAIRKILAEHPQGLTSRQLNVAIKERFPTLKFANAYQYSLCSQLVQRGILIRIGEYGDDDDAERFAEVMKEKEKEPEEFAKGI